MRSSWRRLTAAVVTGTALLGGAAPALAQTTTTTTTATTTTTTTTLQPHPFSPATASCVRDAERARRTCHRSGGTTCRKDFETSYSKCFAAGAGVSRAGLADKNTVSRPVRGKLPVNISYSTQPRLKRSLRGSTGASTW